MTTGACKIHNYYHLKDLIDNKMSDEELGHKIIIQKGDEILSTGHGVVVVIKDDRTIIKIPELSTDPNIIN